MTGLNAGLFGRSFRAGVRLYLISIAVLGLAAIFVGSGYGVKAAFKVTPFLACLLVCLQYFVSWSGSLHGESDIVVPPSTAPSPLGLRILAALVAVLSMLVFVCASIYIYWLSSIPAERVESIGQIVLGLLAVLAGGISTLLLSSFKGKSSVRKRANEEYPGGHERSGSSAVNPADRADGNRKQRGSRRSST
jgi:hypothetical protein